MSLDLALEELERVSGRVQHLKELVRKDAEESDEEVEDRKIWSVAKAEALAKSNRVEKGFARQEKKTNTGLTSAVRDYSSSQHKSKVNKPQGQQKWKGEFETNYQRTKKISTEQSLQEIEEFARTGKVPDGSHPRHRKTTGNKNVRDKLEENLRESKDSNGNFLKGRQYQATIANRRGTQNQRNTLASSSGGSGNGVTRPYHATTLGRRPASVRGLAHQDTMRPSQGRKPSGRRGTGYSQSPETTASKNKAVKDFTDKLAKSGNQGQQFFEKFEQKTMARFKPSNAH